MSYRLRNWHSKRLIDLLKCMKSNKQWSQNSVPFNKYSLSYGLTV